MGRSAPHPAARVAELGSARALLGVRADADVAELTRAYRRRARTLHPDRNPDPEATQRFQALNSAYRLMVDAVLQRATVIPTPAPTRTARDRGSTSGPSVFGSVDPAPDDGVWVVAGPVRVHPASRSVATTRHRAGGHP